MTDEPNGTATPPASPMPPAMPPGGHEGMRRGGTVAGVVLILIGVAVFAGRFVPLLGIFSLWPLIIIGLGILEMFRWHRNPPAKQVMEGLGTVVTGAVLLGNTLGIVPWSAWLNVISLWPLLIVALGLELLGKGLRQTWLRVLSNVLLTGGLLFGIFVMPSGSWGTMRPVIGDWGPTAPFERSTETTGVATASARIRTGGTKLTLGAGSGALATASGIAPAGDAPVMDTDGQDGVTMVTISDDGRPGLFIAGPGRREMDVLLSRDVDWRLLTLEMGAVDARADLRELDLDSLDVSIGASNAELTVGRLSDCRIEISGGATNVILRLPRDAAVTVKASSGLSNVDTPPGFRHRGGIPLLGDSSWDADGDGGPRITVVISSGISNIDIETY